MLRIFWILMALLSAVAECKEGGLLMTRDEMAGHSELATFAGGCFWCMEPPFQKLSGVLEVESGYTGGHVDDPSYQEICGGDTGHFEAIQIRFDPDSLSYSELLKVFWQNIDPTDEIGQFADRGDQYRTAIFYHNVEQKQAAADSKEELVASQTFEKAIVTRILPAASFWPAEDYHQDYYLKQPEHYERYKVGSGRAGFLERLWGGKK